MNDPNPYVATVAKPVVDAQLMHAVATRLNNARKNPPRMIRTLTKWPGVPLLLIVGVLGTLCLSMLTTLEESPFTTHWPIGFACFVLGAILRDCGLALRVARLWPAQSEMIDWDKVEQYSQ